MKAASFGLSTGLPARWPQIDGIGRNSTFCMRPTSRRLSSTVKSGPARFSLKRVARVHQQLPDADPGLAGRHAVASAADLDRCRIPGATRRNHRLPVAGARGAATAHYQQGAQFPEGADPDARCGAITGFRWVRFAGLKTHPFNPLSRGLYRYHPNRLAGMDE